MEWLVMGFLTGWVIRLHNQVRELQGQMKRRNQPVIVNNTVDPTDAAARVVDKHVQEFHRR